MTPWGLAWRGPLSKREQNQRVSRQFVKVNGKRVGWRNYCQAAEKDMPSGQYDVAQMLNALKSNSAAPGSNCVMGVTMADFFSGQSIPLAPLLPHTPTHLR